MSDPELHAQLMNTQLAQLIGKKDKSWEALGKIAGFLIGKLAKAYSELDQLKQQVAELKAAQNQPRGGNDG